MIRMLGSQQRFGEGYSAVNENATGFVPRFTALSYPCYSPP